jgi:hypothetical protein
MVSTRKLSDSGYNLLIHIKFSHPYSTQATNNKNAAKASFEFASAWLSIICLEKKAEKKIENLHINN